MSNIDLEEGNNRWNPEEESGVGSAITCYEMKEVNTDTNVLLPPPTLGKEEESKDVIHANLDVLAKWLLDECLKNSDYSELIPVESGMSAEYLEKETTDVISVCIGAYYSSCCTHSQDIQHMKLLILNSMLALLKANRYNILKQCLSELKELGVVKRMLSEKEFKTFGGGIMEDESEVLKMLFLDGVFIVSCLQYPPDSYNHLLFPNIREAFFEENLIMRDLSRDKNQIPLQVVLCLWRVLGFERQFGDFLKVFIKSFFSDPVKFQSYKFPTKRSISNLSHLYHDVMVWPYQIFWSFYSGETLIPSATTMENSGIKLSPKREMSPFIDIAFQYEYGILTIPKLDFSQVQSFIQTAVNTIEKHYVLEACCVSNYCCFMSYLLQSPADVQLLIKRDILMSTGNWSDDEIINFFKSLARKARGGYHPRTYLSNVCKNLDRFLNSSRRQWIVRFRRMYCPDQFVVLSWFGLNMVIIFTIIQAGFGVASYFKPGN